MKQIWPDKLGPTSILYKIFPRSNYISFIWLRDTLLLPLPRALQISNLKSTTLIAFILITILALGLAYVWSQKGLEWTE